MNFVKIPNLPAAPVSLVVVDGRIGREIENSLTARGIAVIKTEHYPGMYEAVAFHPDIMLHHLGDERIVYAPGTAPNFLKKLREAGFELIRGITGLTGNYPGDIAYNAARVGNFAIHHTKFTDPVLKSELDKLGVEFIHLKQGYTKCSVSVLNDRCIITSDKGIARAVEKKGIEALLIETEKNIGLPGLQYGFIGGSTGLLDRGIWAVTGALSTLRSEEKIMAVLARKQMAPVQLRPGQVIDIGSIIPLKTK